MVSLSKNARTETLTKGRMDFILVDTCVYAAEVEKLTFELGVSIPPTRRRVV
jgi:hypothetical protein